MTNGKDLAFYRSLPYQRVVELEQESGGRVLYIARIKEIPFIRIHGDTREEALARLSGVFEDCIEALIDAGDEIPEPARWPGPGVKMEERQLSLMREDKLPTDPFVDGPVPKPLVFAKGGDIDPWTIAPKNAATADV